MSPVSRIPGLRRTYFIMMAVALAANLGMIAFVYWHPFGYLRSIVAAMALMVVEVLVLRGLAKPYRTPEAQQQITEMYDAAIKGTDDPNEPARFVP